MEKIYLGLILLFFILAFALKNIKTYFEAGRSIKGKSLKLTLSILLSTSIYLIIALRLAVLQPKWILELNLQGHETIPIIGNILVVIGFILGILALIVMKNSWRVGIKYDQKTKLVTSGIYKISRNPYFLSYNILILGYIFVFPSLILIVFYVCLVMVFHKMILEEEDYLETVHGDLYLDYKKKVNRYLTLKQK